MIYLKMNNDGYVHEIHHKPFHPKYGYGKTKEELEKEGMFVDSVPEPPSVEEGKRYIIKIVNGEITFESFDMPVEQKDEKDLRIEELEREVQQLKETLNTYQINK